MTAKKTDRPKAGKAQLKKTGKPEAGFPVNYYLALVCGLFGFLLYANTIGNGYVLDDQAAITNNLYVQQGLKGIPQLLTIDFWHFSSLRLGYYRPLSLITYAVEYQFFGLNPQVSHFNNALLYAILVFFIFLLVSKLLPGKNQVFPMLVALLFAAHPIHTEVVANIKGRDELLSFLNIVVMLWFALRYTGSKQNRMMFGSILFFYLALLSKESALVSILLVPMVSFFTGFRKPGGLAVQIIPYAMVIAIFYLQKKLLFETTQTIIPNDIVNYPYNSNDVRFSSLFMLFLFFIRMLAFPHPLRYDYSYNQIPAVPWDHPLAWAGLAAFAAACFFGIREFRKGSLPGLAIAFYLVTLIPAMGFILLRGGIFAERFLFAPSLGFCIALGWLAEKVTRTDFRKPFNFSNFGYKSMIPVSAVVFILVVLGSLKTVSRNLVWKDPYTLYSNDIKTGSESAQNQLHLGVDRLSRAFKETDKNQQAKYISEGMSSLREATRILPTFGDAMFYMGYAYELKASSEDIKNIDSAIWYYEKAAIHAPAFFEIYIHLGDIYKWMQQYDRASFYFNEAVRYNPSSVVARNKAEEMKQLNR